MTAKLAGTTGLPFEVREVSCHTYEEFTGKEAIPFVQYYADEEGNFYEETELDFNLDPPQPKATISGWVCRDKDGALCLYYENPMRGKEEWFGNYNCHLPEDSFPSLTWESEPIEVEITIKPKKQ